MGAEAGAFIAVGLVIAAWVSKAQLPPRLANAAGWVLALVGTLLLMAEAFGWRLP
jgi:hypothetical protein